MKGDILSKKAVYVVVDKRGKLVLEGGISKTKIAAKNCCVVEEYGETTKKVIITEA